MNNKAVHWHEGMFLRPHHFQVAHRYLAHITQQHAKWDTHFNWGVQSIELDTDALSNYRLVVRRLRARFRDGTVVSIPEDGELPALPLRPTFTQSNRFQVFLAMPVFALRQANAATSAARPARYVVETLTVEDENTGTNPKPIQVRRLNLKLVSAAEAPPGHELLPLACLEKSPHAEATPQLDHGYIPPVLSCEAWPPLQVEILQAIYHRIEKKIDLLVKHFGHQGFSLDSAAQGEPLMFHQLAELNEASAVLRHLAFGEAVHPLEAYSELGRIVGQLAIFGEAKQTPELPRYDHDDLARCFTETRRSIDRLLDTIEEPAFEERKFVGAGYRMQVSFEPAWLEPGRQIFVGVQSPLPVEECVRLLTAGQLDLKMGSSSRVEDIFRNGQQGILFAVPPFLPRALPQPQGRLYLQLQRDRSQEAEWTQVQKTLSLALRVKEQYHVGDIQGQSVLNIKHGGRTVPLQFTLYVVREA